MLARTSDTRSEAPAGSNWVVLSRFSGSFSTVGGCEDSFVTVTGVHDESQLAAVSDFGLSCTKLCFAVFRCACLCRQRYKPKPLMRMKVIRASTAPTITPDLELVFLGAQVLVEYALLADSNVIQSVVFAGKANVENTLLLDVEACSERVNGLEAVEEAAEVVGAASSLASSTLLVV